MTFEDLGLLFFTVLMLSLLLTPACIRFANYVGAIDNPGDRSVHTTSMPRLGGLGMALALLAGLLLFALEEPIVHGVLAGLVIIIFTGLADDIWNIRAKWKLLGQILAVIAFIEISGVTVTSLGNLLNLGEVTFSGPVAYAATLFLFVGTINAFNLSDGLDGLASGIVAIICLFFAVLALKSHIYIVLLLSIALFSTVLGFLKFNSFPAKLFMGDTGSLMLGFCVTAMGVILAVADVEAINKPITIGIVLAMPVIDTLWVMTRRIMNGNSPSSADNTHLHHRLLALGLPHSMVVSILYIWVALFGFLALFVRDMAEYWQFGSTLLLSALLYTLLTVCERRTLSCPLAACFGEKKEKKERQKLIKLMGYSMKIFPYVILAGLFMPLFFVDTFSPAIGQSAFILALLIAVAFPWKEHQQRSSIVYGLYYLCAFVVLWIWSFSSSHILNMDTYIVSFACLLFVWSAFKIKFKGNNEVFLTSSFELLLILISWLIPYILLPVLGVSVQIMEAAKLSCLVSIPLFIALKLTVNNRPQRNKRMVLGMITLLVSIGMQTLY